MVDDNIVNRRVCVAQLQKLGVWSISEAEDGRQAIAAAQNQAFDLILMDVQMPEIDGLEATHQIRLSLSNSNSKTTANHRSHCECCQRGTGKMSRSRYG